MKHTDHRRPCNLKRGIALLLAAAFALTATGCGSLFGQKPVTAVRTAPPAAAQAANAGVALALRQYIFARLKTEQAAEMAMQYLPQEAAALADEAALAWYALGLIALLLVGTALLVLLLYHGRYEVQFTLDQKGALGCTTPRWAKRSRAVNTATVVLGALSGKPAVMGAGVLAQQGQQVFLQWSHIETVTLHPKSSTIVLRSGWMQPLALFCTASNYPAVQQFVKTHGAV